MLKSLKQGLSALSVVAITIAGSAMPASADVFVNPYGYYPSSYYSTRYYPSANYVDPYYYSDPYAYSTTRRIVKPALIGAGIGAAAGLGVSVLTPRRYGHSRHYVRNMGIGAGIGAGVGALSGLIRNRTYY